MTEEMWICPACVYIHNGPLPDNFICPMCGQPGKIFIKRGGKK